MYLLIWRGVGLLVPVIALLAYCMTDTLFKTVMPESAVNFLGFLLSTIALVGAGVFFKRKQMARHLYWIPMEWWSVATGVMALMQVPSMFGHS